MINKPWYPIVYMFVITAVFSGVLIALNRTWAERTARNERLFRQRAVVVALGLADDDAPGETIHDLYVARIRPEPKDAAKPAEGDNVLHYALLDDAGKAVGYGVPLRGQGFWDEIAGLIGVAADRRTVLGIAFYQQKETPGLGAEIVKPEWRRQFVGKTLADGEEPLAFVPAGSTAGARSVEAVTGATQTSTRLAKFLNEQLAAWRAATEPAGAQEGQP